MVAVLPYFMPRLSVVSHGRVNKVGDFDGVQDFVEVERFDVLG